MKKIGLSLVFLLILVVKSFAEEPKVDAGDTSWMLISTALVMIMTPGLALFYGGMVRKKNVLGTMMHSFIAMGIATVIWVLFGYSLAFGPDVYGIIGNLDFVFLNNVSLNPHPDYAPTIPHQLFMIFQMMFVIITPALISGAIAERIKFTAYLTFLICWIVLVYLPVAHWVWGVGGWIRNMGALDFAGGLVVHITSGVSALAGCIVLGKRKGYLKEPMPPHNLTMTLAGTALLWFGWFGFNGGSAIASGQLAVSAFVTTHIASASASFSWLITEWVHRKKPTLLGFASGAVAGLVAITPAAGFVKPMSALLIGIIAGVVCYIAVSLKSYLGYDDSLDAVGVHGVGGTLGAILTGLFATKLVNPGGSDGLFYGNPTLLWTQLVSVFVAISYSFIVSFALFKIIDKIMGIRVSAEEEVDGLDISQHGENGYGW